MYSLPYIPSLSFTFFANTPTHYMPPLPPYVYFSTCVVMTSTQLGEGGRCCSGAGWDTTGAGWDTTGERAGTRLFVARYPFDQKTTIFHIM